MRRSRARRWSAALGACVVASLVGGPTAVGQEEDEPPEAGPLAGFEANADAAALGVSLLLSEVVPLPIEAYVSRAQSKADSAPRATAVAGPVDVPIGAALALLGVPIGIPTSCTANYPGFPERVDCGVLPGGAIGNLPVGAAAGHAEATGDSDELTSPKASALAITASTGTTLFTVSAGESESSAGVDDGKVVAEASMRVGHIEVAGGLLDLGTISTNARAVATGVPGEGKATSTLSIAGGNIGGLVPFDITADGIVFTLPSLPKVPLIGITLPIPPGDLSFPAPVATALRSALNPLLRSFGASGLSMRVLPATSEVGEDGQVKAVSGALEIVLAPAGQSNEYRIVVGQSSATAFAVTEGAQPTAGDEPDEPVDGGDAGDTDDGGGLSFDDSGSALGGEGLLGVDGVPVPSLGEGGLGSGESAPSVPGAQLGAEQALPLPALDRIANRFRSAYAGGALGILLATLVYLAFLGGRQRTMFSSARRIIE